MIFVLTDVQLNLLEILERFFCSYVEKGKLQ